MASCPAPKYSTPRSLRRCKISKRLIKQNKIKSMSRGLFTLGALVALGAYFYPSPLELPQAIQELSGRLGALSGFGAQSPTATGGPAALASSARAFAAQEFDYVIVGGGTAGLVLAARLTEDESVRVGVLEAGGYVPPGADPRIDWIINYSLVFGDPQYDWRLKSVPQEGLDGRVVDETV